MDIFNLTEFLSMIFSTNDTISSQKVITQKEWYSLYQLALKHKVESIFYRQLCLHKELIQTVPESIRRALRSSYKYNHIQNSNGIKEANHIAEICSNAGIQICAVKGIALLNDIYKDLGIRPMQDIDFFALYDHYTEIDYHLKQSGYVIAMVNDKLSSTLDNKEEIQSILYKKLGCDLDCDRQLTIDITFKNKNYNICDFIKRSKMSGTGQKWRTLNSIDFAYLLCYGLYEDAIENNSIPTPKNCSIGKLIDLIGFFYTRHIEKSLLKPSIALEYAQECAYYIFRKNLFY